MNDDYDAKWKAAKEGVKAIEAWIREQIDIDGEPMGIVEILDEWRAAWIAAANDQLTQ